MEAIINNIALISLVFSLINISITIYKWYNSRPRLAFYPNDNMVNTYKYTTPSEYHYQDSNCIVFYYIKVANLSDMPCTISEFTLSVENYSDTVCSKRVFIRKDYNLFDSKGISHKLCIHMPLTIPPLGYAEGFLVFPFAPKYNEEKIFCTITAKTPRKNFDTNGFIKRL